MMADNNRTIQLWFRPTREYSGCRGEDDGGALSAAYAYVQLVDDNVFQKVVAGLSECFTVWRELLLGCQVKRYLCESRLGMTENDRTIQPCFSRSTL